MTGLSSRIRQAFDITVAGVFGIILLLIMLGITIGAIQLVMSVWELLRLEGITGHYIGLITDVLTLYVLVELSRALVEYFSSHKLRLTFIADAAIVFIIREILIGLFRHALQPDMLYAYAALLVVLGALRIGSVLVYRHEKRITGADGPET